MTSINRQTGFSLMEVLVASSLFAFTFVSSLQLYLYIFGQWEQQGHIQQTHQQLVNDIIENKIQAGHAVPNNQLILHTTLSRPIPQSAKLSQIPPKVTVLQTTLITTEPYHTQWQDVQTMMPFTSDPTN